MGAIKDKEYFPKTTSVTKDGWRVLVQYAGVYTRFKQYVAQKGDPLGSVIVEGPGVNITIENVNLGKVFNIVETVAYRLINKFNKEVDWNFIDSIIRQALAPYGVQKVRYEHTRH